ncbi:MAG: hypothetical protein NTV46_01525 [Verrucomicrobia bacterium]|jgi:antitoxin component YwqK of YwqJK toxin-antitoxin module|nr:hypothetical protein [Verrucomicrobiota bacterium]
MKTTLNIIVGILLVLNITLATESEDYLNYRIPSGAKKVGPYDTRDTGGQEYLYFAPGVEASRENIIAIELIQHGVLVKRKLLKNDKKHGIQREWHLNGKPKLEAPYQDGNMEGRFKVWNANGDLIGQYTMLKGTGVVTVYDEQGRLVREDHYKDNLRDGLRMERVGKKISLTWSKEDHLIGVGYDFYDNGELATILFFSNRGEPNGPMMEFSSKGALTKMSWYLNGREVQEAEYAAAVVADSSLPTYHADGNQYKQMVGENVRVLLEKYRTMQRVQIPLR